MKKWLIASGVCMLPITFLGLANPIGMLIANGKNGNVNVTVFSWYVFILAICIAVVATTTLMMTRYASTIDRIEQKEKELDMRNDRLCELICHYNDMISKNKKS